jgi:hypothetical protein
MHDAPTSGLKHYIADLAAREIHGKSGDVQRVATGWISTPDADEAGDIVLPEGMVESEYFKKTKSVNLNHNREHAIGKNRRLKSYPGKGVYAETYFGTHALGEDAWKMVMEGILSGISIEFPADARLVTRAPTDAEFEAYGSKARQVFAKWELLSYAFTAYPCNPNAQVDGYKSRDLDDPNWVRDMTPKWEAMEGLMRGGKIHRTSAVAAGLPDTPERRVFAVAAPRKVFRVRVGA